MVKRLFDLFWTLPGIIVLSPLMLVIALWIRFDSSGPVLFRQKRVGQYGKLFEVLKFRTMVMNAENHGLKITVEKDSRITRPGSFLRKYKLDELPQLFNVLLGDMSLVGPRPEVLEYVDCYPEELREKILSVRPGITDRASIEYRDENRLLDGSSNPEKTYIEEILPVKLTFYSEYVDKQNILLDIYLIIKTFVVLVFKKC